MRDPARIEVVLEGVRRLWVECPDLRLTQLIVNAVGPSEPCPEIFYCEDDALLHRLQTFAERHGIPDLPMHVTGRGLRFATEELGEIVNPTPGDIEEILNSDAFGKFAILSRSDMAFIQAASMWEPGDESRSFLEKHDSDPFRLEYRDGVSGQHWQSTNSVTLGQVKQAFLTYQTGNDSWIDGFTWSQVET